MKKYFFLIIVLILTTCTPGVQQEATPTFRFGVPVESESNALIAAQSGLRASFTYTANSWALPTTGRPVRKYGLSFTLMINGRLVQDPWGRLLCHSMAVYRWRSTLRMARPWR
jgi:hypothetical protein